MQWERSMGEVRLAAAKRQRAAAQVKLAEQKQEAARPGVEAAATKAQEADTEAAQAREEEQIAVKAAEEAEARAAEAIRTLEQRVVGGGDDDGEMKAAMQALLAEKARCEEMAARAMRARAHAEQKADEERRRLHAALKAGEEALAKAMAAQKQAEEAAEQAFAKEHAARGDPHTAKEDFDWGKKRPVFDAKRFAKGVQRARDLREAKEHELARQEREERGGKGGGKGGGGGKGKKGGADAHGPLGDADAAQVVARLKLVVGEQEEWAKQKSAGGAQLQQSRSLRTLATSAHAPEDASP